MIAVSPEVGIQPPSIPFVEKARTVAQGLRLVGMAAAHLDNRLGAHMWPSTPTTLEGIGPGVEHATITFGGLGTTSGAERSKHAMLVYPENTTSHAHWRYSTDHISVSTLAAVLREQAVSLKRANINGHSMGGPLGLEVARRAELPGFELGNVDLHGSPFDDKDARLSRAVHVTRLIDWPQGPGIKFAFSMVRSMLDRRPMSEAWQRACADAIGGCSARLWVSQICALQGFDLNKHAEGYKEIAGADTQIRYFRPEDPAMDGTVDTIQASERYAAFADKIDVPFTEIRVPDAVHADTRTHYTFLATRATQNV